MSVSILLFCSRLGKVDMPTAADKYRSAGATFELMEMPISKICVEANLMHMIVAADWNRFAAYRCKAMIVGITATAIYLCAAQHLVNMCLSTSAVAVTIT